MYDTVLESTKSLISVQPDGSKLSRRGVCRNETKRVPGLEISNWNKTDHKTDRPQEGPSTALIVDKESQTK